jgi:hypothetical protein
VQEQLALYVDAAVTRRSRGVKRLSVYLGLAVLLAAASLVAVNSHGGASASKFPRVLVPGSSASCSTPPNGFLFSKFVDGAQMNVCISQEGNINQINYPDTTMGHTQIAFDGYCMADEDAPTGVFYTDFSPGSGVPSTGWGAATLTQTAPSVFSMTRNSIDGKYQLSEYISINFQPRSIFVGMTVKNIDPANVGHKVFMLREVEPAIDGSAADDQYNEFGGTGSGVGRTGQAFQGPTVGTNSLLVGATQSTARAYTQTLATFQGYHGCNLSFDSPGYVTGGGHVLVALLFQNFSIAPNASVNVGKFVYRML